MIQLQGLPTVTNYTAQLYTQAGVAQGSAIALSELNTVPGLYSAAVPNGIPAAIYLVVYRRASTLLTAALMDWDGTQELALSNISVGEGGSGGSGGDYTTQINRILDVIEADEVRDGTLYQRYQKGTNVLLNAKQSVTTGTRTELKEIL
jgi:hypothetical protein